MAATGDNLNATAGETPEPTPARIVTVTLGSDGRVYFHDLPPELLEVAAELCPSAPAVVERLRMARKSVRTTDEHGTDAIQEQEQAALRPG